MSSLSDPILPTFDRASFGGITFPYRERVIESAFRSPVHEFPGLHGGTLEKLGRKVWVIKFQAIFDTEVGRREGGYDDVNGIALYPTALEVFEDFFARGVTLELRAPPRPFFPAQITEFSRRFVASTLSGEEVSLTFTEDVVHFAEVDGAPGTVALGERIGFLRKVEAALTLEALNPIPPNVPLAGQTASANDLRLLRQLLDLVDSAIAAVDQADLAQAFLAAKLESVAQTMGVIEGKIRFLQNPEAWPITNAIHNLRSSVFSMAEAIRLVDEVKVHVVTNDTDLPGASLRIFGTTNRGSDLLDLNEIPDPYNIRAGTRLRYVAPLEGR